MTVIINHFGDAMRHRHVTAAKLFVAFNILNKKYITLMRYKIYRAVRFCHSIR